MRRERLNDPCLAFFGVEGELVAVGSLREACVHRGGQSHELRLLAFLFLDLSRSTHTQHRLAAEADTFHFQRHGNAAFLIRFHHHRGLVTEMMTDEDDLRILAHLRSKWRPSRDIRQRADGEAIRMIRAAIHRGVAHEHDVIAMGGGRFPTRGRDRRCRGLDLQRGRCGSCP